MNYRKSHFKVSRKYDSNAGFKELKNIFSVGYPLTTPIGRNLQTKDAIPMS